MSMASSRPGLVESTRGASVPRRTLSSLPFGSRTTPITGIVLDLSTSDFSAYFRLFPFDGFIGCGRTRLIASEPHCNSDFPVRKSRP